MSFFRVPELPAHSRRNTLRNIVVTLWIAFLPFSALAQKTAPTAPAQVAREVRDYRMANEDRIVRELSEFLSIPNIAGDTPNIQRNAAHLVEMLEARGIETHLLPIAGRGPVVFGKLISPGAKRTVIFYAHYDGQPVDAAAWTMENPLGRLFATQPSKPAGSGFPSLQAVGSEARHTATTGGSTRGPLRTTNRRLWPCLPRSMPSGPRRFR